MGICFYRIMDIKRVALITLFFLCLETKKERKKIQWFDYAHHDGLMVAARCADFSVQPTCRVGRYFFDFVSKKGLVLKYY